MIVVSLILLLVRFWGGGPLLAGPSKSPPSDARKTKRPHAGRGRGETMRTRHPARPSPDPAAAIEWDRPPAAIAGVPGVDAERARIRDRYISARFPGMFSNSAELREVERVIDTARKYFEGGNLELALELLTLAIKETPSEPSVRLAQIEFAFLARDGALLTRLARELSNAGCGPEWSEVCRLGHALCPGEKLFAPQGQRPDHAPSPGTPNWILASLDLTAEALATDFHRALANRKESPRDALRRAA
jgi:hypothetical protein